jgi:FixJ family two-component response regulator
MAVEPALIAIVDDDRSVRLALGSLVRSLGYRTSLFDSAEDFLATATEPINCLLCDINMAGMSGWELHATMQASGQLVPTIMISAFAESQASGHSVPDVTVFEKPFDADLLATAIRASIGSRS